MTKSDLLNSLNSIDDNLPIYINCAYNNYKIRRLIILENRILIDVGDVDNDVEELPLYAA